MMFHSRTNMKSQYLPHRGHSLLSCSLAPAPYGRGSPDAAQARRKALEVERDNLAQRLGEIVAALTKLKPAVKPGEPVVIERFPGHFRRFQRLRRMGLGQPGLHGVRNEKAAAGPAMGARLGAATRRSVWREFRGRPFEPNTHIKSKMGIFWTAEESIGQDFF